MASENDGNSCLTTKGYAEIPTSTQEGIETIFENLHYYADFVHIFILGAVISCAAEYK